MSAPISPRATSVVSLCGHRPHPSQSGFVLPSNSFPLFARTACGQSRPRGTTIGYSRYDARTQARTAWNAGNIVGTKRPLNQK